MESTPASAYRPPWYPRPRCVTAFALTTDYSHPTTLSRGSFLIKRIFFATLVFAGALAASISAAQYDEMDYGPFISHTFQLPNGNITLRGIAVPFDAPIDGAKPSTPIHRPSPPVCPHHWLSTHPHPPLPYPHP